MAKYRIVTKTRRTRDFFVSGFVVQEQVENEWADIYFNIQEKLAREFLDGLKKSETEPKVIHEEEF